MANRGDGREKDGTFAAGNKIWLARSSAGLKPKFATPGELWDACVEYFEWNHANPLEEEKLVSYQGETKRETLSKMRAMTIAGLCNFLNISHRTWRDWQTENARNYRPDLLQVIERAEQIIRQQKFEGAAAELLHPNIIARDLGLGEKHQVEDTTPLERKAASDSKLAQSLAHILYKGLAQQKAKENETQMQSSGKGS